MCRGGRGWLANGVVKHAGLIIVPAAIANEDAIWVARTFYPSSALEVLSYPALRGVTPVLAHVAAIRRPAGPNVAGLCWLARVTRVALPAVARGCCWLRRHRRGRCGCCALWHLVCAINLKPVPIVTHIPAIAGHIVGVVVAFAEPPLLLDVIDWRRVCGLRPGI